MEKRKMAGDYEILQSVRLGGKEVLLGYNPKDGCASYMTSYRTVNFLGDYIYPEAIAGTDYLEIMQIFLNRVQEQAKVVEQFREKRKVPIETLDREHCRERGEKESLEGKLIILRLQALHRNTVPPTASLALPQAALDVLRALAVALSTLRNCTPVNSADGKSEMCLALPIRTRCRIGPRKSCLNGKPSIASRKSWNEVKPDEIHSPTGSR